MNEEIWKDVEGFEGRYEVSNLGRVRYPDTWITRPYPNGNTATFISRKGGIKKPIIYKGRYSVKMTREKNMQGKTRPVDELVLSHFDEYYEEGMEIIHLDGDISNNRIDNLSSKWPEDIPGERWVPIKGFEGLYEVSSMGRFISLLRNKTNFVRNGAKAIQRVYNRILKLNKTKAGYLHVCLYKNGKKYEYSVHRIVALHFCKGYKKGLVVNHKDEDKTNNRADNLEWCTELYNHHYGTNIQRTAESNWMPVEQSLNGKVVAIYNSAKEAAEKTGYNYVSLCEWCRGAHKPKNPYSWRYL